MNSVLEYAKFYAGLGWKVFRVNKRKKPTVKWKTECTTAENDEDKFWAKEIENRQEDVRKAVMKWRENGAIS